LFLPILLVFLSFLTFVCDGLAHYRLRRVRLSEGAASARTLTLDAALPALGALAATPAAALLIRAAGRATLIQFTFESRALALHAPLSVRPCTQPMMVASTAATLVQLPILIAHDLHVREAECSVPPLILDLVLETVLELAEVVATKGHPCAATAVGADGLSLVTFIVHFVGVLILRLHHFPVIGFWGRLQRRVRTRLLVYNSMSKLAGGSDNGCKKHRN